MCDTEPIYCTSCTTTRTYCRRHLKGKTHVATLDVLNVATLDERSKDFGDTNHWVGQTL
jgi:hypothetical protein